MLDVSFEEASPVSINLARYMLGKWNRIYKDFVEFFVGRTDQLTTTVTLKPASVSSNWSVQSPSS